MPVEHAEGGLHSHSQVCWFISCDTKERPVNAALVKVPGHTDNILKMSRKLLRPIMASQLFFNPKGYLSLGGSSGGT